MYDIVRHLCNIQKDPLINLVPSWHHAQLLQYYWLHPRNWTLPPHDCCVTANLYFLIPLLFPQPQKPPLTWQPSICSLCPWVCFCFVCSCTWGFFLDSTYGIGTIFLLKPLLLAQIIFADLFWFFKKEISLHYIIACLVDHFLHFFHKRRQVGLQNMHNRCCQSVCTHTGIISLLNKSLPGQSIFWKKGLLDHMLARERTRSWDRPSKPPEAGLDGGDRHVHRPGADGALWKLKQTRSRIGMTRRHFWDVLS